LNPYFLTYEQVIHIHKRQIEEYGGSFGILDRGKLESAVNAPRQTFDGQYLHESIFDMAASYLSSIASNHAFMDGNKRTAAQAAIVF
jgi:death-on-curing protein